MLPALNLQPKGPKGRTLFSSGLDPQGHLPLTLPSFFLCLAPCVVCDDDVGVAMCHRVEAEDNDLELTLSFHLDIDYLGTGRGFSVRLWASECTSLRAIFQLQYYHFYLSPRHCPSPLHLSLWFLFFENLAYWILPCLLLQCWITYVCCHDQSPWFWAESCTVAQAGLQLPVYFRPASYSEDSSHLSFLNDGNQPGSSFLASSSHFQASSANPRNTRTTPCLQSLPKLQT